MRWFSFSLLITGGALLGHLYIYGRLVRALRLRRPLHVAVASVLVLMTALLLFRGTLRGIGRVYDVVAYGWMAVAISLLLATAAADLVRLAHATAAFVRRKRSGSAGAIDPHRRLLARLPLTALVGGGLTAAYAGGRAMGPAEISEIVVPLPRLPRTLDGLTIAQLTDVHVGPFIRRRFIERMVAQTNALKPDVVVITGDLVDGKVSTLGDAVAALGGLRARFGAYFVTGNHEYYSGVGPWTEFLERIGIMVLRNRRVPIGDGGGTFDLVGVDDWSGARRRGGQGYDLDAAVSGRDPQRPGVLLAHQPRNFERAVERGIGLQLSGHTHGGQVFPGTMLIDLAFAYTRGLYRHQDSYIYVSRGCGFWGPPTRLGSAPEIAKIVLTA